MMFFKCQFIFIYGYLSKWHSGSENMNILIANPISIIILEFMFKLYDQFHIIVISASFLGALEVL